MDNTFFALLLQNAALQMSTQAIVNHQTASHLMDLAYLEKLTKMDLAESFAAQGLTASQAPRDAMGLRTSIHVPAADKP